MESLELMPVRVRVTAILKKAIYAGEYKSGEELSLTGVAEKLGISRTPVREAFQALEAEGLITLRMNRGAIVNTIDRKFITDIFDLRILLEGEAAERAAMAGPDVSALLEAASAMAARTEPIEKADYEELNQKIHLAIWKAADNRRLYACLMELWNGPSTGLSPSEIQEHYRLSTAEHIRILEAVRDGNREEARSWMRAHIERSKRNILQFYPE